MRDARGQRLHARFDRYLGLRAQESGLRAGQARGLRPSPALIPDSSGLSPACQRAALTFHIRLPPSSETSRAPSRATVTPTGRPHASIAVPLAPVLARNPVMKSSIGPGRPLFIGKNTTLYPAATDRFQDPCSATKPPLRYRCGNWLPV